MAAKAREVIAAHASSFARAVAAGVKIAMGTDSGVGPHGSNLDELPLMAAGGMTPAQVLTATTQSAAELLRTRRRDRNDHARQARRPGCCWREIPFDLASLKANIRAVYTEGRKVR